MEEARVTCTNCGRTWGQKAEERRRVECLGGVLLGLCNGCMRRRPQETPEAANGAFGAPRTCPACRCTWWMADGRSVERAAGYENYCGTCHAGHRHWLRMTGAMV